MAEPLTFSSATPRFHLPVLFAGQSQKEFYVNQAHVLADALLHPVVRGIADVPPDTAADGECWIVGPAPTGQWADQSDVLASWQGSAWIFIPPTEGMQVLNQALGQNMRYSGGWSAATAPDVPAGGSTVDTEARAAILQLVEALVQAGILPES